MEYMYTLSRNGELCHWGIKGQKWGIRRYQNKDGSLTPAGRKRYEDAEARLAEREKKIANREEIAARKKAIADKKTELREREKALRDGKKRVKMQNDDSNEPKSIDDMTDDELRAATNRMNLEKNYRDALSAATVTKGQKFFNTIKDKSIDSFADKTGNNTGDLAAQALKSVGAKFLNDMLDKAFDGKAEKVHANNKKKDK